MKLLITAPYFYPKVGGMENYAWNLSKGVKDKWDVVVITTNHESNLSIEENREGIKIYRLPYLFKLSNTPINPFWISSIKNIIDKEKPDVINAHSPVPFFADITRICSGKIPFILTYHAGSMVKSKFFIDFVIKIYESVFLRLLIYKSNKIISTSNNFALSSLILNKKKVSIIHPGVDTSIFKSGMQKPKNTIIFVGRIEKTSEWKGLYYLLDAISLVKEEIKDIHLKIVGTGDAIDLYKSYSKKIGIIDNVTFVGKQTGDKLVEAYQNSNILVLPSTSSAESFGMVLIEAMAVGIPVIGSRIGGIPDVIEDNKDGILVKPKNSSEIAHAITELLKNPSKSEMYGRNGLRKVQEKYSWKKQIEKYKEVLYDVIQ